MKVKRLPSNELYHHGIKGQRWGVRRFQNEDGSLTSAGQRRYSDGSTLTEVNPTSLNAATASKRKYTTGQSKGVKRRGEGLGAGPVGREDKYFGRKVDASNANRFTVEYSNWYYENRRKSKKYFKDNTTFEPDFTHTYAQDGNFDNCPDMHTINGLPSLVFDENLKDNQVGYRVDPKTKNYAFTFKDQATFDKWANAVGLSDAELLAEYKVLEEQGTWNTYTPDDRLNMLLEDRIDLQMKNLYKNGGTMTLNDVVTATVPNANFVETSDDESAAEVLFPAIGLYDMDKPVDRPSGYLSENNKRDKESGAMDEAERKINTRQYYLKEASKSAQRAEQTKAYNKKLSTKAKRLGQSFKEVYSEGYDKAKGLLKRKKNLKHSDIYSNVKRLPSDTLCHRGIKGQKHGIRRYQYANGTYTREGNERYRPRSDKRKLTKENAEKSLYAGATAAAIIAIAKMALPTAAASSNVPLGAMAAASVLSSPAAAFTIPAATIAGGFVVLDAILEDMKKEK